jgi:hypothetical protein
MHRRLRGRYSRPFDRAGEVVIAENTPSFEAEWVAIVRSTADRLEGELARTFLRAEEAADFTIARRSIDQARRLADRPGLMVGGRRFTFLRRTWRRLAAWWTGYEVDQAWAALHTASQALLGIESKKVVKSQLGDMAAQVVTAFDSGDVRVKDYLKTLELLAPARVKITAADRAQLRAIRQACDTSADGGHTDARAFRNTLILVGSLLAAVLVALAVIASLDASFRTAFSARGVPGHWFVAELEMMASLSGLTGAVLSLRSYSGFQSTYGLPLVQAFLKGTAGAATGLLGVLLTQSGIVTSLKPEPGARVFAVAVVFGYGQYLFTRLVDQQAKTVLTSAGTRNDPGTTTHVPVGDVPPSMLTTRDTAPAGGP